MANLQTNITEVQFRALANSMPNLAWMADPDGWINWYNDRWYEYTGTTPEEMEGWGWQAVHHPDVLPEMLERWTAALRSGETFEMTFPLRRGSDGSFRTFMTRAEPLRENGKIVGWLGTNTDITEQERTRERLQLVIQELNHRVKNMLATVQSIAHSSFASVDGAAYDTFERRLISLGNVHELLTRQQWSGADLRELVEGQIASFGQNRFKLSGPDVLVEPRIAGPLAMTLHELATNAVKYGALSNATGTIDIGWTTEVDLNRELLTLNWTEQGGPVPHPPERDGFGLRMIKRVLSGDRGAVIDHQFAPEGVRFMARLILSSLPHR